MKHIKHMYLLFAFTISVCAQVLVQIMFRIFVWAQVLVQNSFTNFCLGTGSGTIYFYRIVLQNNCFHHFERFPG